MSITELLAIFLILLAASVFIPPLADKIRLPAASLLVLAGFLLSELLVSQGVDTGIRANNFKDLIVFIFLPVLIFDSAYRFDIRSLTDNLSMILVLAIIAMALSALLAATGIYYGINHPTGFPWTTALVTGALLVATDPVAVVAQLRSLKAPHRLETLLEGESLFNDATAIVLFSLFLTLALMPGEELRFTTAAAEFSLLFFGGIAVGIACGSIAALLLINIRNTANVAMLSLLTAYGSFYLGEHILHVSGIMATLLAGLIMGHGLQQAHPAEEGQNNIWELLSQLANNLVFLLMGITITVLMFQERWLAMLIAIAATLVARIISTYISIWLAERIPRTGKVPGNYKPIMIWGGLRGVVTIALALSLPTELEGWWTVQAIAFGVVVFSLWVQAPTNQLLIRKLLKS